MPQDQIPDVAPEVDPAVNPADPQGDPVDPPELGVPYLANAIIIVSTIAEGRT